MADADLAGRAAALAAYVDGMRDKAGYDGAVDVVTHSFGACIARQCLEVADGTARQARVRQLIMLGPPNNGSALAELFSDPDHGPGVTSRLEGAFVPPEFDPFADPIVQDMRPGSRVMRALRAAGLRHDIAYRVIVTANPAGLEAFFPWFEGRTWELAEDGAWQRTLRGDGVVAHAESALPGVPLEVFAPDSGGGRPRIPPQQFCHIRLTWNPAVIDRVAEYLLAPAP